MFWSLSFVEMLMFVWRLDEIQKKKFDQGLCKNLWFALNPRVLCAFGNVWSVLLQILAAACCFYECKIQHQKEATRSCEFASNETRKKNRLNLTNKQTTGNRWWFQKLQLWMIFQEANHCYINCPFLGLGASFDQFSSNGISFHHELIFAMGLEF